MRLIITEEEKDEIINKYKDNTDNNSGRNGLLGTFDYLFYQKTPWNHPETAGREG